MSHFKILKSSNKHLESNNVLIRNGYKPQDTYTTIMINKNMLRVIKIKLVISMRH